MFDEVCSFCKKGKDEVKLLFRAEDALICDQCAKKFRDTLAAFNESTPGLPFQKPPEISDNQ